MIKIVYYGIGIINPLNKGGRYDKLFNIINRIYYTY